MTAGGGRLRQRAKRLLSVGPLPKVLAPTPLRLPPRWRVPRPGHRMADDVGNQIKEYASATSVAPGEELGLHVSVNPAERFTVEVFRVGWYGGRRGTKVAAFGPWPGRGQPPATVDATTGRVTCGWEAVHRLPVGRDWPTGSTWLS